MGIDIGTVLKLIGGIKQLKVGSVFAEGTNIIKQSPGASIFGADSLLNTVTQLQSAFSNGGLMSVFTNNPVASLTSSIQNLMSTSLPSVQSIMTTTQTTSGSGANQTTTNTQSPTYPQFTAALQGAITNISTYYYWTKLLSGQSAPDYDNNEYGLNDILDVSASGGAALSSLVAPLEINSVLTTALTGLTNLIGAVTTQNVSDVAAVSQLNTLMQPIMNSLQTSQGAYYGSTSTDASATVIGMSLGYLNGLPSPQSDLVESLLSPSLVAPILAQNQQNLQQVEANSAQARARLAEQKRMQALLKQIAAERSTEQ